MLTSLNLGLDWRFTGVTVNYDMPLGEYIFQHSGDIQDLLDLPVTFSESDMTVLDQYVGEGYGIPTQEVIEAIHLAAQTDAIMLDPNYTGTVMAALIDQVRAGALDISEPVVFLHTGGLPAFFTFADDLRIDRVRLTEITSRLIGRVPIFHVGRGFSAEAGPSAAAASLRNFHSLAGLQVKPSRASDKGEDYEPQNGGTIRNACAPPHPGFYLQHAFSSDEPVDGRHFNVDYPSSAIVEGNLRNVGVGVGRGIEGGTIGPAASSRRSSEYRDPGVGDPIPRRDITHGYGEPLWPRDRPRPGDGDDDLVGAGHFVDDHLSRRFLVGLCHDAAGLP